MLIIDKLMDTLSKNKKVILIASDFSKTEEALAILDVYKDIKVLSTDGSCSYHDNAEQISCGEEQELLDLYYLYEFSDKFLVFENSSNYGSVFHYVDEGMISFEEAINSLIL
ncbi:hypothetical protein [Butyrivibrio fibrisolvens]|uniref:hypothetical protein n=1 Tax=Butyrivibrio fibrisolvens TaxID=831 RepID=UPI0003B7A564|nr:hypothetical protein [Butyrivibrio fibrisolvens]